MSQCLYSDNLSVLNNYSKGLRVVVMGFWTFSEKVKVLDLKDEKKLYAKDAKI